MKVWIILISMMAAGGTWWWNTRDKADGRQRPMRQRLKIVGRSLMAGVGVYFTLMAIAFIYLMLSSK